MSTAQTPEQLHQELARAYNNGNVDGLADLFEPDATLVPQPGEIAKGAAQIRAALTGFVQIGGSMSVETLEVIPAGDSALSRTVWTITEGGQTKMTATGLEILRKSNDGKWRFLLDHPFGGQQQS